jgi:1,2-phenylacetyl-CoA epoxidase PaaB subunit
MYYLARRHQPHRTFLLRRETTVQIWVIAGSTLSMVHPATGELHDVPACDWKPIADVVDLVMRNRHGRVGLTASEIERVARAALDA